MEAATAEDAGGAAALATGVMVAALAEGASGAASAMGVLEAATAEDATRERRGGIGVRRRRWAWWRRRRPRARATRRPATQQHSKYTFLVLKNKILSLISPTLYTAHQALAPRPPLARYCGIGEILNR